MSDDEHFLLISDLHARTLGRWYVLSHEPTGCCFMCIDPDDALPNLEALVRYKVQGALARTRK